MHKAMRANDRLGQWRELGWILKVCSSKSLIDQGSSRWASRCSTRHLLAHVRWMGVILTDSVTLDFSRLGGDIKS